MWDNIQEKRKLNAVEIPRKLQLKIRKETLVNSQKLANFYDLCVGDGESGEMQHNN